MLESNLYTDIIMHQYTSSSRWSTDFTPPPTIPKSHSISKKRAIKVGLSQLRPKSLIVILLER